MRSWIMFLGALSLGACRGSDVDTSPRESPTPAETPARAQDCADACDSPWTLQPLADGSLQLGTDSTPVLVLQHGGFRAPGQSAKPTVRAKPAPAGELAFEVTFATLPVTMHARVEPDGPQKLKVSYTLDAEEDLHGIPGVGIQIDVMHEAWGLRKQDLSLQGADVELDVPGRGGVRIGFEPSAAVPKTAIDAKRPTRVRAAWLAGDTPKGKTTAVMTIETPGALSAALSAAERYGGPPDETWHVGALVHDDWPVDLSFLNAAHGRAGSHGRVVVDGEDLRFGDGTPARFWGTNIAANALFEADDATITREAKRLSALGFNLVRLHHHDSAWARRNVFDTTGGTTSVLDPKALDRLDRWIDTLAQEGIYVWLDLHTGREFLPGDDIPGYADMLLGPQPRQSRGFNYINPRVESLLEDFAQAYLQRKNPYTGNAWSQEPAVVGILLTNENDLTHHFGGAFLPNTKRETHAAMFEALGKRITGELALDSKQARKVWQPGDGKVLLAEMQHRWDARALAHLRGLAGSAPAVTTNFWGFESLLSLPPLAAGDMIDVHSYGEPDALSTNPHRSAHWLHHIATAQVAGKPLTVTEWGVPKPAADRFTAPLWIAALGSLQGWDALLGYNYAQTPLGTAPRRPTKWDQRVDPAQLGLGPTAALMYRRGDVSLAQETFAITPSVQALWNEDASPKTRAALRTAPERSRMVVVLPDHPKLDWDGGGRVPQGSSTVTDLAQDLLQSDESVVRADTGQIERDWARGVLRIDTPRVQAVSGWIGGETITLSDLRVRVETPAATVVAIALDEEPLSTSKRVLVTAVGRARPRADGQVRSEPIRGEIALRTQAEVRITPAGPRSRATDAPTEASSVAGTRAGAWVRLPLPHEALSHWFFVSPQR